MEINQSIPPVQDSSLPEPKVERNNKLLFALLSFLFLIVFGLIGTFAYQNYLLKKQVKELVRESEVALTEVLQLIPTGTIPTPSPIPTIDPTTDWETYTNLVFNYSFKYPKDFKLSEETDDAVRVSNNLPPDPNCEGGGCNLETPRLTIYFEHFQGEDELSLDEFAQQRRNLLLGINNDQGAIQTLEKYGYEMRYFEGTTEGFQHNYYLKLNTDTNFVIAVVFSSREDAPKYTQLETQILSTFKSAN
ncbi:MAG: hypothetical protein ABID04_02490 [Patescibacteria group bacterium]